MFCEHVSESASVDCVEIPFVSDSPSSLQRLKVLYISPFPNTKSSSTHFIFVCIFLFSHGLFPIDRWSIVSLLILWFLSSFVDGRPPSELFYIQSISCCPSCCHTQSPDPQLLYCLNKSPFYPQDPIKYFLEAICLSLNLRKCRKFKSLIYCSFSRIGELLKNLYFEALEKLRYFGDQGVWYNPGLASETIRNVRQCLKKILPFKV